MEEIKTKIKTKRHKKEATNPTQETIKDALQRLISSRMLFETLNQVGDERERE
jgi:hypothetical protein